METGEGTRPIARALRLTVAAALLALIPAATAQGATWLEPEKVSLPAQSANPADLAISGNHSGRAVAIWRDGGSTLVSGALLPAGTFDFNGPNVISDGGSLSNPRVSVGNGGVAVAVWQVTTGDDLIKAARLDATATTFGGPLTALDSPTMGEEISEPAVAVTPSGEAHIVGDGPYTFFPFTHQWGTAQGTAGGAWSGHDDFNGNNENQNSKLAAGDHESVIWIGKHDTGGSQRALSVAGMTAATNDWVGGAGLAGGDGNGAGCLCGFLGHDLARLPNGDAVVMLSRNSGGTGQDLSWETFDLARAQNAAGTEPTQTPLTTDPANRAGGDRRLVSNSAGTTAAVWGGIAGNIWFATRPNGGSFTTPAPAVSSGADPGLDAAIAGNGDVHIVYTAADKVWGVTVLAGGGVTAPDQISGAETSVSSPKAVAFANGSAAAIWEGNDPSDGNTSKVYASVLDITPVATPPVASPATPAATPSQPAKKKKKKKKKKRKK